MCAALKPLLLCLSHFRKGTNSSLVRTHWLAGWSMGLEGDTWVFCLGVLFLVFFFFSFLDQAVGSSQFLTLTWRTSFLVPFEILPSEVLLCILCVSRNNLAMSTESSWEELGTANDSRPGCVQGQPVCPTWQGLIWLKMYHPNVPSTLAYSMCLPNC